MFSFRNSVLRHWRLFLRSSLSLPSSARKDYEVQFNERLRRSACHGCALADLRTPIALFSDRCLFGILDDLSRVTGMEITWEILVKYPHICKLNATSVVPFR